MKIFIFTFVYLYVTFSCCPYFELNLSLIFFSKFYFLFFILNYLIFAKFRMSNLKVDLLFNWLKLFLINSKNFILFSFIIFKKILYFFFTKLFHFFKTMNIFFKSYSSNFFLIWRPLFKKLSYFGFFRTNKNKWIK